MYKDPEQQAAYYRAYRVAHLEELRAYSRAYYAANRERKALRAVVRDRRKAKKGLAGPSEGG